MALYLDYSASSPISRPVLETVTQVLQTQVGNPDSRTHDFGHSSMQIVKKAREQVASLFGVKPGQVIFTSGATESNNMAILGLRRYASQTGKRHIITSSIEHKAVLESVRALEQEGFEVDFVNPDESGCVSKDEILEKLRDDTLLVSLMHVNNETGIIQPVSELGAELKKRNVLFHVDATQSAGKLVEEIQNLDYDFLSFSAHKFQGPQGIGGLIIKTDGVLVPILFGGHQEQGLRPGTTPVALCAGLGTAAQEAQNSAEQNQKLLKEMKQDVLQTLSESGVLFTLNGDQDYCVDSMINVCFEGVSSEALMIMLKGVCAISNGSACTSKEYSLSYVLKAMNLPDERVEDSVRISWGPDTDCEELKNAIQQIATTVKMFQ